VEIRSLRCRYKLLAPIIEKKDITMLQLFSNSILNFFINIFFGTFGILGFYNSIRKKYPKSITYVETEKINLNSSVLKNIDDLKITYKDEKVQNDLYLIRGFLLNNGKADIQKSELENNLSAKLSEGKWINCKIISASDNLVSKCYVDEDSLYVESELFKIDEYIYFEALAETSSKRIEFSHRIANLGKIKNINFEKLEKRLFKNIIWSFIVGFLLFLTINSILSDVKSGYLYNIEYKILNESHIQFSFPTPKNDTVVTIRQLGTTMYTLGDNSIDSIAQHVYKNNDIFNLIYNHPDSIIKLDTEPMGKMKVHLNKDAITEIKANVYLTAFLLLIFIFALTRLSKTIKHLLVKKRVVKTTGNNIMYVK